MTVTDDERREVAERLRAYGKESGDPTWRELCNVVFGGDNRFPTKVRKLHLIDRLADLIDPGDTSHSRRDTVACGRETESGQNLDTNQDTVPKESPAVKKAPETCKYWLDGECYARRTIRPVDRDALLALADKMKRYARLRSSSGMDVDAMAVGAWVNRIREACGVVS